MEEFCHTICVRFLPCQVNHVCHTMSDFCHTRCQIFATPDVFSHHVSDFCHTRCIRLLPHHMSDFCYIHQLCLTFTSDVILLPHQMSDFFHTRCQTLVTPICFAPQCPIGIFFHRKYSSPPPPPFPLPTSHQLFPPYLTVAVCCVLISSYYLIHCIGNVQ